MVRPRGGGAANFVGHRRARSVRRTVSFARPRPPESGSIYAVYLPYAAIFLAQDMPQLIDFVGVPYRIRTGVAAVRERQTTYFKLAMDRHGPSMYLLSRSNLS